MNKEASIIRYLDKVPVSVEGCGGSRALYHACASIICAFDLTAEECFKALLYSGWNDRCEPPWKEKDLERCANNAHRDISKTVGWMHKTLAHDLRKRWGLKKQDYEGAATHGKVQEKPKENVEKPVEHIRIDEQGGQKCLVSETTCSNGTVYRTVYKQRGETPGCYIADFPDPKYAKRIWCFEYLDASGKPYLLYKRIDTVKLTKNGKYQKYFLDFHWDPIYNAYVRGTVGLEPVPFRLAAFPYSEVIFVVEGEKCAVALNYWFQLHAKYRHCLATTVPHGAGSWKECYNNYFSGKSVCVLPDNDEVGLAGARKVMAQLRPYCREVYTITGYPDYLEAHGDIYDVLKAKEHKNDEH